MGPQAEGFCSKKETAVSVFLVMERQLPVCSHNDIQNNLCIIFVSSLLGGETFASSSTAGECRQDSTYPAHS